MAQTIENLSARQEMQVLPLGQEDPLEKEMATHSSIFAWRTPWTVAHQAPLAWDFPGKNILEWVAISCSRRSS